MWEEKWGQSLCKHTQRNKQTHFMMLQSQKTNVYCSFCCSFKEKTQTCWNLRRPNLNLPPILFNRNTHPRSQTHTHTQCTAVLYFLWKQVATSKRELWVWMCAHLCRYSPQPRAHTLVSAYYSPASHLIRSTAGLRLCHIYIQMEI